jgi:hypothetical protein
MKYSNFSQSNSNIEIILMKYATAVLDAKNGVTNPTLGEMIDPAVEAIQQELLKARIDEISILRNGYGWGDALETSEYILDDRLDDLQAKLKGDDK